MSRYLPPRSSSVKAVNAVGRLLRAAGVSPARLDEGWLLGRAARNARLSDFGDEAFREPLQRLLRAYEEESHLTLIGRIIAQRDTLRILENRLEPGRPGEAPTTRLDGSSASTSTIRGVTWRSGPVSRPAS